MKSHILLAFAVFLGVYILPLGLRPMITPDETRYAEIPREMLTSGDWIVPRLVGVRYFEKPPAGYWATACTFLFFGENRFAARLPSALAAGLAAFALVHLLRRERESSLASWIAPAAFLINGFVYAIGTYILIDSLFSALVTGVCVCFYCAWRESHARQLAWLAASGVLAALAFLTKGILGLALPAVAIAPFLLWQRDRRSLFTLPWVPLATATAVVLPWAILIHFREQDFWRYFMWEEHLERFFSAARRSHHPEPFWWLLPFLVGGILPWTLLIPAAIRGLYASRPLTPLLRYALCWLAFPLLLLSCSRGKLGTYVLPCMAPLSILIAAGVGRLVSQGQRSRWIRGACIAWAILLTAALLGILLLQTALRPELRVFAHREIGSLLMVVLFLAVAGALAIRSAFMQESGRAIRWFAASMIPVLLSVQCVLPARWASARTPEGTLSAHHAILMSAGTIYTSSYIAPAIAWTTGRIDIHIINHGGEMHYGLEYPDDSHRLTRMEDLQRELSEPMRTTDLVVFVHAKWYDLRRDEFPPPSYKSKQDGFVLLHYKAPRRSGPHAPPG